ncbi:MAG TPA: diaminopimelate epimerase [Stellaceae bacterium]
MPHIPFRKMHGLGNDFVVLDGRRHPFALGPARSRAIADRRTGIGCDQLILLERPRDAAGQAFMRILNADGSEAEACGNATRCIARILGDETGERQVRIETAGGLLEAELLADGRVRVDMGPARTAWNEIPLAKPMDTLRVDLVLGPLAEPVCTNIGNPHATFFANDVEAIDLAALGPRLEHDPLFPERANIGVATIDGPERIRLRVWERGAGITRACGTGACAALVAAHRRGLTGRHAALALDGGELDIVWREDGRVMMTGPATLAYEGRFDPVQFGGGAA